MGITHRLVLTDISMPEMDGLEATSKITKLYKKAKKSDELNVIGISGHVEEAFQKKAKKAGMRMVESKPMHKDRLKQLLQLFYF